MISGEAEPVETLRAWEKPILSMIGAQDSEGKAINRPLEGTTTVSGLPVASGPS